jgi:ATP-dependent DNA helicase
VAPLSTLSNWEAEFEKWTPSIPVVLYHGTPVERNTLRKTQIFKNLSSDGRPNIKFPVVLTSPEIVIRDEKELCKVNWEMIIIVSFKVFYPVDHSKFDRTKAIG